MQNTKYQLLRAQESITSILPDETLYAEDLMIRSSEFTTKATISELVADLTETDPCDILSKVNEINVQVPALPPTQLKSFS